MSTKQNPIYQMDNAIIFSYTVDLSIIKVWNLGQKKSFQRERVSAGQLSSHETWAELGRREGNIIKPCVRNCRSEGQRWGPLHNFISKSKWTGAAAAVMISWRHLQLSTEGWMNFRFMDSPPPSLKVSLTNHRTRDPPGFEKFYTLKCKIVYKRLRDGSQEAVFR